MTGDKIVWNRSRQRNALWPFALATRTNTTGYLTGKRSDVAPSDCLRIGTKGIRQTEIYMRVDMLPWLLIAVGFHGMSSQTGSIMTTINRVSMHSD